MDATLSLLNPIGPGGPAEMHSPATKSADAAKQFEGLLMTQLLRAAHSEGSGWLGTGDDEAGGQATALAEEFLAQAMAAQGGLGIAKMVHAGLIKGDEHAKPAPTPVSPANAK